MKTRLLTLTLLFVSSLGFSQHVYQFNGNFNETGAGPALTQVFDATCAPAGVAGSFTTDPISTSAGGSITPKPVFSFTQNGGFSYSNTTGLGITGTYTIHILCKKTNYSLGAFSFQRVIDFANGADDNGLYANYAGGFPVLANVYNASIAAYTNFGPVLDNTKYNLITIVRDNVSKDVNFYVDGAFALTYNDAGGIYASNGTNPIVFFRDDITAPTPCESGPGLVRYISLSTSTSTAGQVGTFWTNLVSSVLPVSLTTFNAQKTGNDALLQWQTGTEVNTAYFNVERSYDGITFNSISKVNAKGLSANTYTYNDVAGLSSGNTYYRLKITDNNGNYKYSSVVRLANGQGIKVSVFPNPATDVVTVSGLKANDIIKLLAIDGKLLLQQNASGAQSTIVNIAKYKPGTYILQVQNDAAVSQQKIIKY
jgi:hypothetical protein